MTIDEAKSKAAELEHLNLAIWDAKDSSTKSALSNKFKQIFMDVRANGFKILRRKVFDANRRYNVFKYKIRDDGSDKLIDIIDNRPVNGCYSGDCTTRCISFCTGIDYSIIQHEQFVEASKHHGKTWRTTSIWEKSLLSRGFCKIYLPRKVARKTFLKLFNNSKIDDGIIATLSSGHVAAIDMKKKKILDLFNCAGQRIFAIYVPNSQKQIWENAIEHVF